MSYCQYYQATVDRSQAWYFVAILRSYEHVCFDRTFDTPRSIFEFYVPESQESDFLQAMEYFEHEGIITNLQKMDNRLINLDVNESMWS